MSTKRKTLSLISIHNKIQATLNFLRRGSYQKTAVQDFLILMSQQTLTCSCNFHLSKTLHRIIRLLSLDTLSLLKI